MFGRQMLAPLGDCNIHHKVKLASVKECPQRASVLNYSPCVNKAYGNHLIPGYHGSGFIFVPGRAPGSPPIFVGCTLDKGISMAL